MLAIDRVRLKRRCWSAIVAFSFLCCGAALAVACSVPVFRYALERWEPDPYVVTLFYEDKLDDSAQAVVDALTSSSAQRGGHSNVEVRAVDVNNLAEPAIEQLWKRQNAPQLPWMVVGYPRISRIPETLWSGPPSTDILGRLLDSPLRRETAERLLDGHTAVWLLLESGDKAKDDAAAELIEAELARLHEVLELPALAEEDSDVLSEDGPELKIKFSALRLSRFDPAEAITVPMLLGTEPDLVEYDEPMVFPVFGRGRAHFALVGKGIDRHNIEDLGRFLVGECSCEVKEQNPGVDLLMTARWDALEGTFVQDETIPPLMGLPPELPAAPTVDGAAAAAETQLAAVTSAAPTDEPAVKTATASAGDAPRPADSTETAGTLWSSLLIGLGGLVLLVVLGSFWMMSRSR